MKFSFACFVALLMAGPVANAQVGTTGGTDKATATQIEKRIAADPSLKKYDIKVTVDGGVATLSGSVATEAERTKAAADAKVAGVTRVDNQILVEPDAGTHGVKGTAGKVGDKTKEGAGKVGEKTKEGAGKVGEKTKEGAGKVGEKTKEGGEKTKEGAEKVYDKTKEGTKKAGEEITDGWITTRIKSKFVGEDALKDSDIHVSTDNHVVTLTGTVMSPAGRAKAVALAKEVEGVRRVDDRVTVGPKKQ
jgi:osmotically-inducible protein OsmY